MQVLRVVEVRAALVVVAEELVEAVT